MDNNYTLGDEILDNNLSPQFIKRLLQEHFPGCDYISRLDLLTAYRQDREKKKLPCYMRKYLFAAMVRDGYKLYYKNGRACFWVSDGPKPKPGKRKKRETE